ncbi:probable small intestine urate exporter [Alligator mississippiensis]|uniref:Small intestine urate exporter n=1 Tax=Alligator mississippiensis TaxID=8496 RepID=A0A151MMP7_ALLMI|nr:probable small intestine urate exporter [Alligator mississippiensis]XP_019354441.1 probable small intestine urate exporter [Alligator mississippiensis]KYO25794.1 putative small intestine urate exporter [Alligator mississippiensis]
MEPSAESAQAGGPDTDTDTDDAALLPAPQPSCCQGLCSARWGLAVVLHITLFMVYALRVNLSMAIVAMTNATHPSSQANVSVEVCSNHSHAWSNGSHPAFAHGAPVYDWSAETQGVILSSFFYGYIFTQMLGGYWAGTLGGKVVLGCGLFLTSALTLFVPLAAKLGVVYLIGLQVLLGLAEGVIFPAQYTLWAKWAPPMERSRLMNIADAGCTFGTFLTYLVAGFICQCLGWPYVFYIFGGIGCVWSMFWFLLVYEDPACHPCISARERDYIVSSLASQGCSHGWSLPLKAMARSLPLWAIVVACFCTDWLFYTLLTSMPTYMNNVLHFNIQENGLLSALPYVGNGLGHILSGLLADLLLSRHVLSTAAVRKLFSAVGMLLPGAFLVAVSYIGCNYTAAVAFLTLSLTVNSTTGAGLNINHIDIAPRYAGFLLGITNTFGIIAGIIAPTAVGFLTSQDLVTGWRNVFFLSAGIDLFGLLFYVAFGNGTIQEWAKEDVASQ